MLALTIFTEKLLVVGMALILNQDPNSICTCTSRIKNSLCQIDIVEKFEKKYIRIQMFGHNKNKNLIYTQDIAYIQCMNKKKVGE